MYVAPRSHINVTLISFKFEQVTKMLTFTGDADVISMVTSMKCDTIKCVAIK